MLNIAANIKSDAIPFIHLRASISSLHSLCGHNKCGDDEKKRPDQIEVANMNVMPKLRISILNC